jgi:hypothetical protein
MFEVLFSKLIALTVVDSVLQEVSKVIESRLNILEMLLNPGLQHTETQLNWIKIWGIWGEKVYLTAMLLNHLFNPWVAMDTSIIHDDNASWSREDAAIRQKLINNPLKVCFSIKISLLNASTWQISINHVGRENTPASTPSPISMVLGSLTNWGPGPIPPACGLIEESLIHKYQLFGC